MSRETAIGSPSAKAPPAMNLRKVFIVVFNRVTPLIRLRRLFGGLPKGF